MRELLTPNSPLAILTAYADAFRELVNARVWGKDESPIKALRLNSSQDWDFICVAMDVIGDAALAIDHFFRFSLDGPTRYVDTGERYLRLYGVLSATYLQQEAVIKLYFLMNCPNPKGIQAEINNLEIRTFRHQIASHSVDFRESKDAQLQAFVPVRVSLSGFRCTISEGRGNSERTVKLDDALNEHCRTMTSILDRIYEKSVKTFFRNHRGRTHEFNKKLADLRFIRDGNMLLRLGDASKHTEIRIVFVKPKGSLDMSPDNENDSTKKDPGDRTKNFKASDN
jgi:hypothetical protein